MSVGDVDDAEQSDFSYEDWIRSLGGSWSLRCGYWLEMEICGRDARLSLAELLLAKSLPVHGLCLPAGKGPRNCGSLELEADEFSEVSRIPRLRSRPRYVGFHLDMLMHDGE